MPLVDYSSDSDSSASGADGSDAGIPPKKQRRTGSGEGSASAFGPSPSPSPAPAHAAALPPLPPSFHDLYASTVRTATRDDPSLHQGRTRQNPHVPGNWPSHIYIEWHPPSAVHSLLVELVSSLQAQARTLSSAVQVTSLLLSDLAAPQPLHISLSRPIVLSSAQKDTFSAEVEAAIRASGIAAFTLACSTVEWHRTAESGRSFLVLRVHGTQEAREGDTEDNPNPELTELLRRCNAVVAKYGQPGLYRWAEGDDVSRVWKAFHVSIAWSFAEPTEELKMVTERVFGQTTAKGRIQEVRVPVEGIKVKIGNTAYDIAIKRS
ncbi:3b4ae673-df73-455c-9271-a8894613b1d4 [Thermothielavioides terrestris]|uniref:U6 snRNA phosphodiesterase n=1 Tax=Thermothielavioides terrestris TaxID=2587410 RepID=A0A446B692_9PEZI|nr:3b4ae673-df73-455c-9271-a8894613b1d4 [Thermothielavioides terrestris]